VYSSVVDSVVGFVSDYFILQHLTASALALIALLIPVIALWLSYAFNQALLILFLWLGAVLVLPGLAVHHWGEALIRYLW
jgi:drug/metabolite transporter (DMT)-like permease